MKFNRDKCKAMHPGWGLTDRLGSSFAEKDLEVLVGSKLHVREQCAPEAKVAGQYPELCYQKHSL